MGPSSGEGGGYFMPYFGLRAGIGGKTRLLGAQAKVVFLPIEKITGLEHPNGIDYRALDDHAGTADVIERDEGLRKGGRVFFAKADQVHFSLFFYPHSP